ncbi:MAG: DUF3137 domain-containing protein [Chitinophagaceae bacterium]|nr:DUF3137 domain-containing protein [Chitinophagaceae bacterium]
MTPTESFDQLYSTQLLPALESLELSRKTVMSTFRMAMLLLFSAVPFLIIAISIGHPAAFLLITPSVLFFIFKFIDYGKKKTTYTQLFKEKVIGAMVKVMGNQLVYTPGLCIAMNDYVASGIFRSRIDRYTGDDLVAGQLGATAVKFSELHHEEKHVTTDSKGHRQESWVTIFKGIFFIADFNKNFSGNTYIVPDAGDSFFGIGRLFEKWVTGKGELVKLESPEFEKYFTAYSTDQVEARYILSTTMMEKLVQFRKKVTSNLHLSFVHSNVNIALSIPESLFEPNIFSTGIKQDYLKKYFVYLELITGIVDDLNLNLRIWGK